MASRRYGFGSVHKNFKNVLTIIRLPGILRITDGILVSIAPMSGPDAGYEYFVIHIRNGRLLVAYGSIDYPISLSFKRSEYITTHRRPALHYWPFYGYFLKNQKELILVKEKISGREMKSSNPPVSSCPNFVKTGPVFAIPAILTELGVRPQRAFAMASVDPALFQDPDEHIEYRALGHLFDACVSLTKCDHFGLLVGERFELTGIGPVGYLMRNSATVGDALRTLVIHLHLHDRGAAPILFSPDHDCTILGYSIYQYDTPATEQIYDTAIAIGYRILQELCGPSWKPLCVQFSHNNPSSTAPYCKLFRAHVSFNAEVSGIAFKSHWLQNPIAGADPVLHDHLVKVIQELESYNSMSFTGKILSVLPQMILSDSVSANAVASLFGISERTLRRRLKEQGYNLQQLLKEVRFELARQLLQNTTLTVTEVSTALQYADPNIFSRAFRTWAGLSPLQWRDEQQLQNKTK